jgi:ATP-dependent Clp protease ATP-binding subunit ClpC
LGQISAEPGRLSGRPRRTPAAEEAVAAAEEMAESTAMGSHHLLEALARSESSLAAKVLAEFGIDPDALAAKIDELGIEGTTDVTPEEAAARQIEVQLVGEEVHVVLRDETTVQLVRSVTEQLGGALRGDDPAAGSLVGLWQGTLAGLEEVRRRVAPAPDEPDTGRARFPMVRQAIQSRLSRRRRT